ncbi:hypothetical protein GLOTRDRAFT_43201 [Gloeophyllum trabeum ATCC 11539]|uniref:Zinc knuckle-domain-containing protein n=1 Tax=Gloeophyllum trabeum (strain ATCC 11539 / FP-39264 / Madison 617) TaxID=670483 RepID=S7Q399_GLOTA|nr:uncharacterized protein GLOTRDRAFT_43201 [Gloeophyllum trabeum ATCC 11539]EPQ54476.1 hypothetical protein GLOTRDRAFT_43201 [Gloeophyllum trabeum ATCC 11539]
MSKYAPHRRSYNNPQATSSTVCQRCLGTGHFTYQCKSTARPYLSRPSRTQQLENPKALAKLKADGKPSVEVPEEFKTKAGTANRILSAKEKERAKVEKESSDHPRKRAKRGSSSDDSSDSDSDSGSNSDSDSSSSASDSESGSGSGSSGSDSEASRSRERDHKRRVPHRRRRSVSSSSSGSSRGSTSRGH